MSMFCGSGLEELYASHCHLADLQRTVARYPALQILDVSFNELDNIETLVFSCSFLSYFYFLVVTLITDKKYSLSEKLILNLFDMRHPHHLCVMNQSWPVTLGFLHLFVPEENY